MLLNKKVEDCENTEKHCGVSGKATGYIMNSPLLSLYLGIGVGVLLGKLLFNSKES